MFPFFSNLPTDGLRFNSTVSNDTDVNLTSLGGSDWAVWLTDGTFKSVRKSTGGDTISNLTLINEPIVASYSGDPRIISWTDGTPITSGDNNGGGVYFAGLNDGFSFTVPAGTSERICRIYCAAYSGVLRVQASLSDASYPAISYDFPDTGDLTAVRHYVEIAYRANSGSQTMLVSITLAGGETAGNVAFTGVHLS